jgi:hypothetical protein
MSNSICFQVPFGEVKLVKDWLKIEGHVDKPKKEHPQRPILGFDCTRSEVRHTPFCDQDRGKSKIELLILVKLRDACLPIALNLNISSSTFYRICSV